MVVQLLHYGSVDIEVLVHNEQLMVQNCKVCLISEHIIFVMVLVVMVLVVHKYNS